MKKSKKVLSVILSLSMAFSMSLIQPNYQVKADNSYSVLDSNDNGKEEGAEVTPIDISSGKVQIDWSNVKDSYEFVGLIVLRHKSEFTFLEPKLIPGHNSWEFVIVFLESKLVKLTIDSGCRHTKSSGNIR